MLMDEPNPDVPPVVAVRFESHTNLEIDKVEAAEGPSVLWRLAATDREASLEGPGDPLFQYFEVECRAPTCPAAQVMGKDILSYLEQRGLVTEIASQYDEPDDASQQRGHYYAHVFTFGMFADVPEGV